MKDNNNNLETKSILAIILALFLFFPLGLYWMWAKSNWKKPIKIIITAFYAIYMLLFVFTLSTGDVDKTSEPTTISASEITKEPTTKETTTKISTTTEKATTTQKATTTTTQRATTTTTQQEVATSRTTTAATTKQTTTKIQTTTQSNINDGRTVYVTPTGNRYHFDPECGGKNSNPRTLDYAISLGLTPCQKCAS